MALSQTVSHIKVFNFILGNCLLALFASVTYSVYKMNVMDKKYYFAIPATILIAAVIYNYFILIDYAAIAYSAASVFFIILFIPVFLKKTNVSSIDNNDGKNLRKTGTTMFFIALFFTLTGFLLSQFAVRLPYLLSIHFAVFTIAYQIPGFLYCRKRLRRDSKNISLSQLTKREKEVALEICKGLKYEEIADKLFVSLSAVKKHAYNIYRKLGIKNNRELMLLVNNAQEPSYGSGAL
jgi:DNA-binding CsgD family transcriptional regulator